jgi:hypothetical protein
MQGDCHSIRTVKHSEHEALVSRALQCGDIASARAFGTQSVGEVSPISGERGTFGAVGVGRALPSNIASEAFGSEHRARSIDRHYKRRGIWGCVVGDE